MLIGTISTERQRGKSILSGRSRRECIADAISRFAPDLLVCAGHSLHTNGDLKCLMRDVRIKNSRSAIIVEVENDKSRPKGQFKHCMYVILPGGVKKRLGRQVFATSDEVNEDAELVTRFEKEFGRRTFSFRNKSVIALACGEINILRGRKKVDSRSPECEHILLKADIVVNPTHDRMGNAGTLLAKRKFLSKRVDKRVRVYVSSSNWDSKPKKARKSQAPTAATLHDYFVSGKELRYLNAVKRFPSESPPYEYRQALIAFD